MYISILVIVQCTVYIQMLKFNHDEYHFTVFATKYFFTKQYNLRTELMIKPLLIYVSVLKSCS